MKILARLWRRCHATLKDEGLALAAIAAVFAGGCAFVGPWRDVPVIDDWVYAWSVEHFLGSGQLRIPDISSIYPLAQILWGSLFARVLGFSFGALRISTVVVAAAGCWAFYLTLRELAIDRLSSTIGALALALHPVYFALSFSFMTDVPFVSASMVAMYLYTSALRRDSIRRMWMGSAWAVVAFLIRPIALILPLAALLGAWWWRNWRGGARAVWPAGAALATMAAALALMSRTMGAAEYASVRVDQFQWWFTIPMAKYALWNVGVAFESVFPLAPLLLASLVRRRTAVSAAIVAAVTALVLRLFLGYVPSGLPDWGTWSLQDIAARAMVSGHLGASDWSAQALPFVKAISVIAVAALIVGLPFVRQDGREGVLLVGAGVLNVALINLLWFYNDRYYLVLAPTIAYVAIAAMPRTRVAQLVAILLLVPLAVAAFTGTRDMLDVNEACAAAARELEAQGIAPSDIDAGYSLDGWRLYVHPERLPPGADRRSDVPFVTSNTPTKFSVSNIPVPGYAIIRVIVLPHAWWQITDRLYVLRRQPT